MVTHTDMREIEAQTLGISVHKSHHFCNIFHSKLKPCVFIPFYIYTHTHQAFSSVLVSHHRIHSTIKRTSEGTGKGWHFSDLLKLCSSDSLTDQFGFYGSTYIHLGMLNYVPCSFILHYCSKTFYCIKPL